MQRILVNLACLVLAVLGVTMPWAGETQEVVEISTLKASPTVEMKVVEDTMAGWNIFAEVSDFSFATGSDGASSDPTRGFLQLHVDGEVVARVYGPAYHLKSLDPGEHEIRLSLHSADGRALVWRGDPLGDRALISVPDAQAMHHGHHGMHHGDHSSGIEVPEKATAPGVKLGVTQGPLSGWTVKATVTDFAFTPELAGAESRFGEGHAHLFVNGKKVARVYGKVYHLPELEPGMNRIRLTLNGNDHSPYLLDGEEIAAEFTLNVQPGD